jgi:hypothetical protein
MRAHGISLAQLFQKTMEDFMKNKLFNPIILSTALIFVPAVFAQQPPNSAAPGVTNPSPGLPQQEILPSNPGQVAPKGPDFQRPIPGQQGTIPEIVQQPGTSAPQQMTVSPQEIQRAQETLKARGYDPGATSGNLHTGTQDALRKFQKDNKLPITGVLDERTAAKLGIDTREDSTPKNRSMPDAKTR